MKTNHTPGEWIYRKGSYPHFQSLVYSEETGEDIAVTYSDETAANARLIAAAPDLLAALQELIADIRYSQHEIPSGAIGQRNIRNAEAAIQKATNQ